MLPPWADLPCPALPPTRVSREGYLKSGVIQRQCHWLSGTSVLSPQTVDQEVREGVKGSDAETSTPVSLFSPTVSTRGAVL